MDPEAYMRYPCVVNEEDNHTVAFLGDSEFPGRLRTVSTHQPNSAFLVTPYIQYRIGTNTQCEEAYFLDHHMHVNPHPFPTTNERPTWYADTQTVARFV
jgi:hypothetical protein